MPRVCFVIGPIGAPGSPVRAHADDFMEYIVSQCPALAEFDYARPLRADRMPEPGRITSQIIKQLLEADLVIADLTGSNANVYYELSLRHALRKPVVHMALEETTLSFDVLDNRTIFFSMQVRKAEVARNELAAQIRRIHEDGYRPTNPIVETLGVIRLEASDDPDQRALGHLIGMVEELNSGMATLSKRLDWEMMLMRAANYQAPFAGFPPFDEIRPAGTVAGVLTKLGGGLLGSGLRIPSPEEGLGAALLGETAPEQPVSSSASPTGAKGQADDIQSD